MVLHARLFITLVVLISIASIGLGCNEDEFQCTTGRRNCISSRYKCDGRRDCMDGSDETPSACSLECPEGMWRCASGQCIGPDDGPDRKCDGWADCKDGSDESPATCGDSCGGMEGRFQCASGQCIRAEHKCNGPYTTQCDDRSDETPWGCSQECPQGYFRCKSGQCIELQVVRDGMVGEK